MDYRTQLDTDGYLILENFFDQATIDQFSAELNNALETVKSFSPQELADEVYFEKDSRVFLVGDLPKFSPFWADLENFQSMIDLAGEFLACDAYELEFIQALIKHPQADRKVNWHRDFPNDAIPRENSQSVRFSICLDAQTKENGGIRVIKNSHVVSDEGARVQKMSREISWRPEDEIVLSCAAGSVIVLHPKIVHGGPANLTAESRRIVTFSWADSRNSIIGKPIPYSVQYEA